ncbi:MAG: hypothetical protein WBL27_11980 [Salinimicrobium sp.]
MRFLRPLIFLLFLSFQLQAQEIQHFSRDTIKLRSDFIDEVQTIQLYLPQEKSGTTKTYPIVYLLNEQEGLFKLPNIPEAIFVQLNARSPKATSDAYLSFIEKELLYFMDSHYPASGETAVIGSGAEAALASEFLMKRPDVFDNYIIIAPEFSSDNEFLNNRPTRPNDLPAVFFAAEAGNGAELQQLQEKLKGSYYKSEDLHFKDYSGSDFSQAALKDAFNAIFRKD